MTAKIEMNSRGMAHLLMDALTATQPPPDAPTLIHILSRAGFAPIPEDMLVGEASAPPFADIGSETIDVVLQALKNDRPPPPGAEPEVLTVNGVFFDCQLLYPGWWTASTTKRRLPTGFWTKDEGAKTVRNIRHWLNAGFEQWGPSWQLYDPLNPGAYVYGQIGHGDESNSLPVIVSRDIIRHLRSAMGSLHAISVVARGLLYHSSHATAQMPDALRSTVQHMMEAAEGQIPYYLVVDSSLQAADSRKYGQILLSPTKHDVYSAYMWQCLIREQDRALGEAGTVPLQNAIFVWEHTNLLDSDSIKFNYDSLEGKKRYLERKLGEKLLLLQHSYPVNQIVDDVPADPLIKPSVLSDILSHTRAQLHQAGPGRN